MSKPWQGLEPGMAILMWPSDIRAMMTAVVRAAQDSEGTIHLTYEDGTTEKAAFPDFDLSGEDNFFTVVNMVQEKARAIVAEARGGGVKIGPYETGRVYNLDCLEARKAIPDGAVDAVVTDPPYGVAHDKRSAIRRYKIRETMRGDTERPDVSWMANKPAIIWGGNNFCDQLPRSTGWLVWFKYHPEGSQHSQAELAWTNCVKTIRHYSEAYHGFMRKRDGWFHPTQKPPGLMGWCLSFLPNARVILDPYAGSGTTGVACVELGREFLGFEIDPGYCKLANDRIAAARKGITLKEHRAGQRTLFDSTK